MAKFRVDSIANLARQMTFTPHETRMGQLSAAEDLLHGIDPGKAYPLDFIVFRITGYHPKIVGQDLLTGLALQHDLGLLIEEASDALDLRCSALAQPVLSIEDVTERFNVTSKTVQRWRRRGLPARRFVFADGKRRVGFLLSSVERFFSAHRDQVTRNANFSVLDDIEREEILRRARILATGAKCWPDEIARRIGRRLNRSPLTILHTLRKHDADNPRQAILPLAPEPPSADQRVAIAKACRRGLSVSQAARQFGCRWWVVYRLMMEDRVARLTRRKVRFIDDPLYHGPDAADAIQSIADQQALPETASHEQLRVPRDLPAYLQELYHTPLLSPAQERSLFLQYNFHRYQFVAARRRLDPQFAGRRDLNLLEGHLRRATDVKNAIIRANLRLVVSIARKHLRPGLNLMELVSDGNLALMRAVEGFDIRKGNRFSTYATLALMKGFARSVPLMSAGRLGRSADQRLLLEVPDPNPISATDRLAAQEEVRHLLSRLNERERGVLLAHYGLGEEAAGTFEQVGQRLGLSKQRVRQIERGALAKLRAAANPSPHGADF